MAGQPNSKLKLLYLKDIFEKYTDEDHVLNSAELAEKLEYYGITCERKSIYKDIDILIDYGVDIIKTRTPRNGFFLASRDFETAEVRLLIDAVQAANFITRKKTMLLLRKIEKFVSMEEAKKFKKMVYIDNRNKCSNEEIYYNIDALDKAIKAEKKIKLNYCRRKLDAKFAASQDVKEFNLSPYALIWSNDHYYLVANNEKYDNLMHLRVDRIKNVEILQDSVRPLNEVSEYRNSFDCADYSSKVFNMFSGKAESVELLCDNEILEQILDRFGENVSLRKSKDDKFILREEMCINDGLASWIMQFGDKVKVVYPETLKSMVSEKAEAICRLYAE